MKRLFSLLLSCLLVLAFVMPWGLGTQAQESGQPEPTAAQAGQGLADATTPAPEGGPSALPQPNSRLEAIRHGKWPAQLAAHSGAIQPDRHGPQRNDPAEGIPKHAYSPFDERRNRDYPCPPGGCEFRPGRVLIKLAPQVKLHGLELQGAWTGDVALNQALAAQGVLRLEPIFAGARPPEPGEFIISPQGERRPKPDLARWYRAVLADEKADIYATIQALRKAPGIAWAEPDYLRKPVGTFERANVERSTFNVQTFNDPLYAQQWHLAAANVPQAWQWLADHGLPPGGSRDIVVAVIDTGVDLNHPDLAANLWTNSREIPGNGVDDDGNGYVDDVHGVDVITNSGNPMDDHGHGTHVAGIIAAQANNGLGGVGVAYNVQVMPIKAAQYSGVLASSDIAEAIYYAVAQGADVINMSFGGYARSQLEEDALAVAFGQAVLVAAAGNDGKVNLPCPFGRDMYPAAYNWVLGVMASTQSGSRAGFSNYDCTPHDSHEYELMAPGVDVWSTLPNEQYAAWDGTSMATPIVSGIAALLRTRWSDKDVYSSRFIMGQIAANTAGGIGGVADAYAALTVAPRPELSYLEHWLFDTTAQAADNDDDGIVDAGEMIDLAIVIRNHWGKADPVTVTLEAWAEGAYQPDPYVTMITGTVDYGAVGSFNVDDNGLIYDDQGVIVGVRHPFRFRVDPNTPNDHVIPFRLTMTARNGLDPTDTTVYTFQSRFYLIVQRGRELPRIISQDMVLTKEYYWLVPNQTLIEPGVAVTVTEGTQVQFWGVGSNLPYLQVEGILNVIGTASEPVEIFPGHLDPGKIIRVQTCVKFPLCSFVSEGHISLRYVRVRNPQIFDNDSGIIDHGYFDQDAERIILAPSWGGSFDTEGPRLHVFRMNSSIIHRVGLGRSDSQQPPSLWLENRPSQLLENLFDSSVLFVRASTQVEVADNVFLRNFRIASNGQAFYSTIMTPGPSYDYQGNSTCGPGTWHENALLNQWWDTNPTHRLKVTSEGENRDRNYYYCFASNFWGTLSTSFIDEAIYDYFDNFNIARIVYQPILTTSSTSTYPFVVDVLLSTAGQSGMSALHGPAPIASAETVTFTVTFNRDMDTSVQPQVSFGPDVPETDYTIHPIQGGWVDPRTWVGTFNVTPVTGDGYQLMRIAGPARAADDPWLVIGEDVERFRFEIQTSGTEAMNLQATGGEGYVDLQWTQNDFDLLAGYNLYRATGQAGPYTRLNQALIPAQQRSWRDTNVQPGQPYYYKFTVVKTDMTESAPSNIATATPIDTIPPAISHTPITEAPPGLPLTIFADVTDNVGVQAVSLHYRAIGATQYISRAMTHTTGNRYSATIEGARVTSPGLEYYIEATDGISTVRFGRPEYPYQITVVDRPVVTAVSPNRGPASGGTLVTIAGSNFKAGATVTFGGAAADNVTVLSSSQITCTTPPHFPATVDVTVRNPDSQSGTLLRGFTYESDVASVSLPDTGGGQYDIVQVPVNAASVNGLAAADLTVTFNSNVLSARGARTGSLTPGWSVVANTGTPGQMRLSMASPGGTVSGSGTLAVLEFEVVGSPGTATTLHIANISFNDGAIPVQAADGSFAVSLVYRVSGAVRFWNGGAGVPGVLLSLEGDRIYSGQTDATGAYTLTGASAGNYTLTPSKLDDVNGISAYDASLVLQHAAGLITLTGAQATAADVNKSGAITSMDAFYILQKAVDLITLPFPGAGVVWDFDPRTRSYSNLSSDLTGQDFTAILLGDVSGNWSAGSGQGASLLAASPVTLTVRGGPADASGRVTATLWLDAPGVPVYSLDLTLSYDPAVASAVDVQPGPLASSMMNSTNPGQPGKVLLAMAGVVPTSGSGELARVTFQMASPSAGSTPLVLSQGVVNEGQVPARLVPGRLGGSRLYLPLLSKQ